MTLYVGNLSWNANEAELESLFAKHGKVSSAKIIYDRITRRSKGFGFVEMDDESEAKAAVADLNGKEFKGRALNVNEARPQENRPAKG